MSTVKDRFIKKIITELSDENEVRIDGGENPLDICYMVSVLDQQLDNCSDFMNVLKEENWLVNGYINGKIRVLIENKGKSNTFKDCCYYINFLHDKRHWGYCECSPEDEGYNEEYDCCGNGCDWDAPAFSIEKVERVCCGIWDGLAKDYWQYEDKFNKIQTIKSIKLEQYKKEREKAQILEAIKKLQNKLDNLNLN